MKKLVTGVLLGATLIASTAMSFAAEDQNVKVKGEEVIPAIKIERPKNMKAIFSENSKDVIIDLTYGDEAIEFDENFTQINLEGSKDKAIEIKDGSEIIILEGIDLEEIEGQTFEFDGNFTQINSKGSKDKAIEIKDGSEIIEFQGSDLDKIEGKFLKIDAAEIVPAN